jgi:hypothetical protein
MVMAAGLIMSNVSLAADAPVRSPPTESPAPSDSTSARAAPRPTGNPATKAQQNSANAGKNDRLELDPTSIRGNQELPKVLYIVPWKDPGLAEPAGRPVGSLIDEALAPVDREVFRRQTRYFEQLYPVGGAQKPGQAEPAKEPGKESAGSPVGKSAGEGPR